MANVLTDFRSVLSQLTPWVIIYADQNAPRPALPYCTLRQVMNAGSDFAESDLVDANGFRNVRENQVATVELSFYGNGSVDECERIRRVLALETVADSFNNEKISLIERSEVANASMALDKSQFEERAILEVKCGWRSVEIENTSLIETVQVTGTLSQPVAFPDAGEPDVSLAVETEIE